LFVNSAVGGDINVFGILIGGELVVAGGVTGLGVAMGFKAMIGYFESDAVVHHG